MNNIVTLLAGIGFFLVAALCLFFCILMYTKVYEYRKYTAKTIGEVIDLSVNETSEERRRSGERVKTYYTPRIRFVTADDKVIEFSSSMSSLYMSTYAVGKKVKVIYNPHNPEQAEINDVLPLLGPFIVVGGLALLSLLVSGYLLFMFFFRLNK